MKDQWVSDAEVAITGATAAGLEKFRVCHFETPAMTIGQTIANAQDAREFPQFEN